MQWKVFISGKNRMVTLPDQIPDNNPFEAHIDGRPVLMRWQRDTRALFVFDKTRHDSWSSINLRSRVVKKFQGESDLAVSSEFLPAGSQVPVAVDAVVSLFIPGQESRMISAANKPKMIRSQITGKILKILVKAGDVVKAGETIMIIEAMKMENRVLANVAGVVEFVKGNEGEAIAAGTELVRLKPV